MSTDDARVVEFPAWVSLSERVPANAEHVLVWTNTYAVGFKAIRGEKHFHVEGVVWGDFDGPCRVTHWMPFPPGPGVESNVLRPEDADPNAPWLTAAHALCFDCGIPPGHISDRIRELDAFTDKQDAEIERLRLVVENYKRLISIVPTERQSAVVMDDQVSPLESFALTLTALVTRAEEADRLQEMIETDGIKAESSYFAMVAAQDDLKRAERLVRDIHQCLKRGERTQDHGLIGNLRCILDHVAPDPTDKPDIPPVVQGPFLADFDKGPWSASKVGAFVQSDDFAHDARLNISADFEDHDARYAYACALAATLNRAADVPPEGRIP